MAQTASVGTYTYTDMQQSLCGNCYLTWGGWHVIGAFRGKPSTELTQIVQMPMLKRLFVVHLMLWSHHHELL